MRTRIVAICLLLSCSLSPVPVLAREAGVSEGVTVKQLLAEPLAGESGKEAVSHVYSFPVGAVLPWHIHEGAHEIAYVIEGNFAIETEGKGEKLLKPGESFYLAPNIVHRGINKGDVPVKLFVVRIKPKGKPLATEVPARK